MTWEESYGSGLGLKFWAGCPRLSVELEAARAVVGAPSPGGFLPSPCSVRKGMVLSGGHLLHFSATLLLIVSETRKKKEGRVRDRVLENRV